MAGHVWKRARSRALGLNLASRATQREQELEDAHRIAKLGRWRVDPRHRHGHLVR